MILASVIPLISSNSINSVSDSSSSNNNNSSSSVIVVV